MPITINGTGTVSGLSVGGVNDGAIAHADLADSTKPIFCSYAILACQKSNGTQGGTFTKDTWVTREINTEIADPDSIVSLSSNQFTLQAGNYLIEWDAVALRVQSHSTALYDVTNSTYLWGGMSSYSYSSDGDSNNAKGIMRVTPSGATAYEIRHVCSSTRSNEGLGRESDTGTYTGVETYLLVKIFKEAS
tara:strand:+ start:135 stop:707 length:573 start_codon:yes stop_codon:yes gene_type:complete